MDSTPVTYSIDELAALAELSRRTVRYYLQLGLLNRPIGEKRAAYYTVQHLEQLLTIRKWQRAGLALERIRELLDDSCGALPPPRPRGTGTVEVWSHLVVAEGVEITIEPARAGLSPEMLRAFTRGVMALFEQVRQDADMEHLKHE